ncbi:MAG TPA: DUF3052 domain-containing protein [Acidimicrobiales bacterium]|nr:DUF3052 domain-containing protein [Acidimicrobiales bacterium]
MAAYSGTPLAKKLGIKAEMTVVTSSAPADFAALLDPLPPGVSWKQQVRPSVDLAVAFFTERDQVARRWPALTKAVGPAGTVWVAWPKRSSGVPTDLTEDTFRELLLPTGWVDTKVCAIDDTWSGLKFVLRKELR